jgi:hypothetical protein
VVCAGVRRAAARRRRSGWSGVVQGARSDAPTRGEAAERLSGCVVEHFREKRLILLVCYMPLGQSCLQFCLRALDDTL